MNKQTQLQKKLNKRLQEMQLDGRPRGSYGIYVKLTDKMGIKFVDYHFNKAKDRYYKEKLKEAYIEANNQKKARKLFKFIPKCYGVRVLKTGNTLKIGILMQHIGNDTLERLSNLGTVPQKRRYQITENIIRGMQKRGISHDDIHAKNIMLYKGNYYAIDFGYITFVTEPKQI